MKRRKAAFLTVILAVTAIWGVLLPRLATTETVRSRTQWLEQQRIDPAAMYYTELPMMDRILAKERSSR
ncbi:hypothetical protein [Stieleria mannarensis]|uniref:hypothetical protein n=1 Tax=Stieleria mannarensis TaxID=2755585 RepID=UPI0016009944|nr:hypothetical protein [Rhodopirellula sp. JC639]